MECGCWGVCALTGHVQSQLTLVVLAHLDPAILTRHRLLKVDDVVASGSVAIAVETKIISAEACTIKRKKKQNAREVKMRLRPDAPKPSRAE